MAAAPSDHLALPGHEQDQPPPPGTWPVAAADPDTQPSGAQTVAFALLTGAALAAWLLGGQRPLALGWLASALAGLTLGIALAGLIADLLRHDQRAWLWAPPAIAALLPWWGVYGLAAMAVNAGGALWLTRQPFTRSWLAVALLASLTGAGLSIAHPDMLASQTSRALAALGALMALAGRLHQTIATTGAEDARIALLETERGTDEETGLPAQRRFLQLLSTEWQRARREDSVLSLVVMEFPPVASAQQEFATAVGLAARRTSDIAARLDNHCYALLLPGTAREGALTVIDALRANVGELVGEVPIRLGLASCFPGELDAMRAEELLDSARADFTEMTSGTRG